MPEPWVIPPESRRPARTCCRCGQTFSPDELQASGPGWSPLDDGWRCPNCTRAYEARIERLACRLIADHEQHRWLHAHEHAGSRGCVFCDVIRRAKALLLESATARDERAAPAMLGSRRRVPSATGRRAGPGGGEGALAAHGAPTRLDCQVRLGSARRVRYSLSPWLRVSACTDGLRRRQQHLGCSGSSAPQRATPRPPTLRAAPSGALPSALRALTAAPEQSPGPSGFHRRPKGFLSLASLGDTHLHPGCRIRPSRRVEERHAEPRRCRFALSGPGGTDA